MPRRRVFYSFHYDRDVFRVQLIRQMGVIDDDKPVQPNPWEEVRRHSPDTIKRWINGTMASCSCVVVLIGYQTATRPWVKYEIERGWNEGKGLLGIFLNKLPSMDNGYDPEGPNPLSRFELREHPNCNLGDIVPVKENKNYNDIRENLVNWVEEAIAVRTRYVDIPCKKTMAERIYGDIM